MVTLGYALRKLNTNGVGKILKNVIGTACGKRLKKLVYPGRKTEEQCLPMQTYYCFASHMELGGKK